MADVLVKRQLPPIQAQVNRMAGLATSFVLSAVAAITLILNAVVESFNPARFGAVLIVLIFLHLLRYRRFAFRRELALYAVFVGYMFLSLFWAPDVIVGMNTLLPALNFVLIVILFGALVTYHDLNTVLAGTLGGFLMGAAFYTMTQGFPFGYPEGFSYNAIAGMYLFGLFITLVFGWSTRSRLLPLLIGVILLVHIAATTSIKTNLGILLGVAAAGLMYFRSFARVLRRNAVPFIAVAGMILYAVASNDAVIERVEAGIERVTLGVEILSSREDEPSGTSFGEREYWMQQGLRGWAMNPLFGHGVEAFRADYGITSHSTPIDLLYNNGIIGLVLFYAMFVSIGWRLFRAREKSLSSLRALMCAALVCYLFITLSATMHYNSFLAVFVAISTALLRRRSLLPSAAEYSPTAAYP